MNTLPGIVSIRYARCADIQPCVMLQSIGGMTVYLGLDATDIGFYGQPKLEWDNSISEQGRIEKATLEFTSSDILPESDRLAFIVTAASGRQFLIGSLEPKYPKIEFSETLGAPDGKAAVRTYKITHTALKSVLPCVL